MDPAQRPIALNRALMTTKNRMEAAKHGNYPLIEQISGREFAAQTMQNYHANLKMFKSS